ncbi:CAP domain-containing protein [Candidatus Parabeggiatoa sp. HSG14]|uniref:CAP domain-containing protein n=1 Tax=Candidatus Parabeggiatoa sp. HSG14 TaxID=3055593 RepID=UPI0025A80F6D|nr:CAP domain-containing protein [Thiotrichales bacterium HSG14]
MKYIVLALALIGGIAQAAVYDPNDLSQAYIYLNQVRSQAGMTGFSQNPQLETSAFNHAKYLADNFTSGHYESEGTPGFTGIKASNRAAFAGYSSLFVSENISDSYSNSTDDSSTSMESIDDLMSAIYHRFGFLSFDRNEVGIGIGKVFEPNFYGAYVYNMGNIGLNTLCENHIFPGFGTYYSNVCEPDIKIDGTAFKNAQQQVQDNNPNIVLWPTDGDNNVLPAFEEESPDPLPDYSISGYPISIQFNPSVFTDVNVTKFKLYRDTDNLEIVNTRLLTESSDPNGKFSNLEYALFPLDRLDWNTIYRAEAEYTTSSDTNQLVWRFKTRGVGLPLYTVRNEGDIIEIPLTTPALAIYVPPTTRFLQINRISGSGLGISELETDFIDGNTLRIDLSGRLNGEATFTLTDTALGSERHFTIKITANAVEPVIDATVIEATEVNTPEVVNVPEVCEPVTLTSGLELHIPALKFMITSSQFIVYWANLRVTNDLQFGVIEFGAVENPVGTCELPTLSSEFDLHIPALQYTPLLGSEAFWTIQADLKFIPGDPLLFEVIEFSKLR